MCDEDVSKRAADEAWRTMVNHGVVRGEEDVAKSFYMAGFNAGWYCREEWPDAHATPPHVDDTDYSNTTVWAVSLSFLAVSVVMYMLYYL